LAVRRSARQGGRASGGRVCLIDRLNTANGIERLDPNTRKITRRPIPFENSQPYDEKQALGSNKIWFSDGGQGEALILFDPSNASFTIYPAPQRTDKPMIRIANDGASWCSPRSAKNAGIGVMYPRHDQDEDVRSYGSND
jgi:streptogramin lyase